jgi:hypothetical protein
MTPLIQIDLVSDSDQAYCEDSGARALAVSAGKASIATCFQTLRLPASYLERLFEKEYDINSEPACFRDAFHHWLLCELIESIADHGNLL